MIKINRHLKFFWLVSVFLAAFSASTQAQLNAHTLMVQGRQKLATDQYFDAITIFSRIIINNAEAQEALFFRGIVKFNLNDFQGARKDFQTCININPFYSHAYHYLGIT